MPRLVSAPGHDDQGASVSPLSVVVDAAEVPGADYPRGSRQPVLGNESQLSWFPRMAWTAWITFGSPAGRLVRDKKFPKSSFISAIRPS